MATSAIIAGVASVASGAIQASAAGDAAAATTQAGQAALGNIKDTQALQQGNAQPFINNGLTASNMLTGKLGDLTKPFDATMATLEATPGYKFVRDQGLKAAQNNISAQGLGASGNAAQGAVNYAEGLAGTQYQNQFDNYLKQNQQNYNILSGAAGQGVSAANNLNLSLGQNAQAAASTNVGIGTGQANADLASGKSIGNALTGAASGASGAIATTNPAYNTYLNAIINSTSK